MRTHIPRWCAALLAVAVVAWPATSHAIPFLGGKSKITVSVSGAPDCNDCGTGSAASLKLRIFQVADSTAIRTILNNKTLPWSKQLEAAAANVLGKPVEEFVAPGGGKTIEIVKDPKATAVVIEGNFCKPKSADWYVIHPARKKSVRLEAGATGFTLTAGK